MSDAQNADFLKKLYDSGKNLNFQNQEVKRVFLMADQIKNAKNVYLTNLDE